eukprot:SAG31_NODE_7617_length_1639_cov_1.234416_2_plen_100_part_00
MLRGEIQLPPPARHSLSMNKMFSDGTCTIGISSALLRFVGPHAAQVFPLFTHSMSSPTSHVLSRTSAFRDESTSIPSALPPAGLYTLSFSTRISEEYWK